MNSKVEPAKLEDLLALFEDVVQPEDVLYAKISSQVSSSITKERLRLKMNQKEFASHIHCQQSQVSRWESGKYNFSLRKLSEICAALDMNLSISLAPRKVQREERFSTDTMMYSAWTQEPIIQKERNTTSNTLVIMHEKETFRRIFHITTSTQFIKFNL